MGMQFISGSLIETINNNNTNAFGALIKNHNSKVLYASKEIGKRRELTLTASSQIITPAKNYTFMGYCLLNFLCQTVKFPVCIFFSVAIMDKGRE